MLHRYVHAGGVDSPVVWYIGATVSAASRSHLHANWQGSITAVTDANASVQWINGYDAYGIPNWFNEGRFQYTGQIMIPELEMYHYKARVYSPTMGRFLQTDPIGYEDQVNLYAYVGNDPVGYVDPSGEQSKRAMDIKLGINSPEPQYDCGKGCRFAGKILAAISNFMTEDIRHFTEKPSAATATTAVVMTLFKPLKGVQRVRHFTNKGSLNKISSDKVIKARDQNSVFTVSAKGRPGSPSDVEASLGLKPGKGNAYIEFDANPSEFNIIKNAKTGAIERVFKGNVDLRNRNPLFRVNR